MGQKCSFFKKFLTDLQTSFTLKIPQSFSRFAGILTEREEADVRHEDKSQDGSTVRPMGLAFCLFTRAW